MHFENPRPFSLPAWHSILREGLLVPQQKGNAETKVKLHVQIINLEYKVHVIYRLDLLPVEEIE